MNSPSGVHRLPTVGQVIDGFRIVQSLGQGGMGAVYKVERQGHFYALKVILDPSQNDFIRFEREAQTLAATRHPNIVSVHSFQPKALFPYIIFDYVEGGDLSERLKENECWSLEEALRTLRPLADALDCIHAQGIIHRDLKPANILIRSSDQNPMLTDFGIAKNQNMETLTQTGEIVGTIAYMSPEQFQGEAVSPQTDLWALSIILYRLMSGNQSPFPGATLIESAQRVLLKPHIPLHSIAANAPKSLELIFQKAFAKSPAERYQSCQAFIDQCERVLNKDSEIERQYKAQQASTLRALKMFAGVLVLLAAVVFGLFLKEQSWNSSKTTMLRELTQNLKDQKRALPRQFIEHMGSDREQLPCCVEYSTFLTQLNDFEAEIGKKDSSTALFRQAKPLRNQLAKIQSDLPLFTLIHKSPEHMTGSANGKNERDRSLIKATQLFRDGDYDRAYQEFTAVPKVGPNWMRAMVFAKALTAFRSGNVDEASKLIRGLNGASNLPEPMKDLQYKIYMAQSINQLFNDPWAIEASSSTLSMAFKLRPRSAENTAQEWSKRCQRRFDEFVQDKPERADALFVNHRKLTYQFPKLNDLVLSKKALTACLIGAERARNEGRVLMFVRRLRLLDKSAQVPHRVQFAFDTTGSFNVYQCVDSLVASTFTNQRTVMDMFNIVLEAQRHGVYLALVEDDKARKTIAKDKSLRTLFNNARFDPFLIWWRVIFSNSWNIDDAENQAKSIEFVVQHPKTPGFLVAQMLTARISKLTIIAELKKSPVPEVDLKQCMKDLERVTTLPHPRPELAYILSYEAAVQERKTKEEIEPRFSNLILTLNKYLEAIDNRRRLSETKQLTQGRPLGVPLARDSPSILTARLSFFYEHVGELYHIQERYRQALDAYLKYCEVGINPNSFKIMLDCLEKTDDINKTDFDMIERGIQRCLENIDLTVEKRVRFQQFMARLKRLKKGLKNKR
ncbi:MAG: serine/threonine-protein kinase [Planctomycetota bacterium]|nr:serine/threonine-protein kinase [Planctomycetota bacterium]